MDEGDGLVGNGFKFQNPRLLVGRGGVLGLGGGVLKKAFNL